MDYYPNNHNSMWKTPENLAELIRLIKEKWSASTIANHMTNFTHQKVSRNAVIGKCHRMHMKLDSGINRPKPKLPKTENIWRPRTRNLDQPKPKREAIVVESLDIQLLDLQVQHCRYPHGEYSPFKFCGQPILEGKTYCAAHAAMCYIPPRVRGENLVGKRW